MEATARTRAAINLNVVLDMMTCLQCLGHYETPDWDTFLADFNAATLVDLKSHPVWRQQDLSEAASQSSEKEKAANSAAGSADEPTTTFPITSFRDIAKRDGGAVRNRRP